MPRTLNLPPCPNCGSTQAAEVVYGYPSPEMEEAFERGEIRLGGCMPPIGEEPDYVCRNCNSPLPWVRRDDQRQVSWLAPD